MNERRKIGASEEGLLLITAFIIPELWEKV